MERYRDGNRKWNNQDYDILIKKGVQNKMRTKYAIRNILTAWIGQIVVVIINFIQRRVFIHYLDISYLGINGLFSNILSLLSLAELGIGTAIVYSLYEPLSKKDWDKAALVCLFWQQAGR